MRKAILTAITITALAACNDTDAPIRQRLEIIRNDPKDQHEVYLLEQYLNMPEGPEKREVRKGMEQIYIPTLKALTNPDGSYKIWAKNPNQS